MLQDFWQLKFLSFGIPTSESFSWISDFHQFIIIEKSTSFNVRFYAIAVIVNFFWVWSFLESNLMREKKKKNCKAAVHKILLKITFHIFHFSFVTNILERSINSPTFKSEMWQLNKPRYKTSLCWVGEQMSIKLLLEFVEESKFSS